MNALVRKINTTASSDVMRGIETNVILNLYEVYVIPCLLNNAESWLLTKKEEDQLDLIGIRVMKRLFNLPSTSPNVSIVYSFGLLYISQIVDKKQFMYLHKMLSRGSYHWTYKTLMKDRSQNIGWAKNINQIGRIRTRNGLGYYQKKKPKRMERMCTESCIEEEWKKTPREMRHNQRARRENPHKNKTYL